MYIVNCEGNSEGKREIESSFLDMPYFARVKLTFLSYRTIVCYSERRGVIIRIRKQLKFYCYCPTIYSYSEDPFTHKCIMQTLEYQSAMVKTVEIKWFEILYLSIQFYEILSLTLHCETQTEEWSYDTKMKWTR